MNFENIIVLILSTQDHVYDDFKRSQESSWVGRLRNIGVKCFYYQGGEEECVENNTISLNVDDGLQSCSLKFQEALRFVLERYPDTALIYRTNLSSYIDVDNFVSYLNSLEDIDNLYAGKISTFNLLYEKAYKVLLKINMNIVSRGFLYRAINYTFSFLRILLIKYFKKYNYQFASGSGFFVGKNHFNKILSTRKYNNLIDDVMIRLALNIEPNICVERFDFTENYTPITQERYSEMQRDKLFHYRFKSSCRSLDAKLLYIADDVHTRKKMMTHL